MVIYLQNFESPSHKDTLCYFWSKVARKVPWKKAWFFICKNMSPLHSRIFCVKFGWNWPIGSGEEDLLIGSMYFCYFFYLPLEMGRDPLFVQTRIPFTNGDYVPNLLKLSQWSLRFGNFVKWMHFCYFVIIIPWKRAWPFIWINLNPLHPRMLCVKFNWNWTSGSGKEEFFF